MSSRMMGVMLTEYLFKVPVCSTMFFSVELTMMHPASLSFSVMACGSLKVAVAQ